MRAILTRMEGAPLRRVPSPPPSRVDPAEAIQHVAAELPGPRRPGRTRPSRWWRSPGARATRSSFTRAALSDEGLAESLARARKALRRRLHPLPGSGWCERAERLISDRLDDALADPGPARLEVHLANCSRCVEHERRLAQAQDSLVAGFVESRAPSPEPEAEPEDDSVEEPAAPAVVQPALLRIVDSPKLTAPAPSALPEAEDVPALPEPEDSPAALPEAEGPPAVLPELEEAETPAALQAVPPSPLPARPHVAPSPPPARAPSPPPARSRLAATYAARPTVDDAGRAATEETWSSVAPLVAIATLAILMLVFAVLAVSL